MRLIVIVDENINDRNTAEALLAGRYETRACSTVAEAMSPLGGRRPDLLIIDEECLGRDGSGVPPRFDEALKSSLVVYSDKGKVSARGLERAGGHTRVKKPYRAEALLSAVRRAIAESAGGEAAERPFPGFRGEAAERGTAYRRLIGCCPALRDVAARIALYATNDAPVLILGESGTGKELAAIAIHRASRRSAHRFQALDCAAIPETLAESALFGTVRGAFTDAVESKGAFESARGGTLFMDEIGELSLSIQAKFLRTLETGSGCRVGSMDPVQYDARILSATNARLSGDSKRFRPELMHRIDTLVLNMPALREHKDDIPELAESFLDEFSPGKRLNGAALSRLMSWDWPGNVRELKNVVRRAGILSGDRDEITLDDIEVDGGPWQASLF